MKPKNSELIGARPMLDNPRKVASILRQGFSGRLKHLKRIENIGLRPVNSPPPKVPTNVGDAFLAKRFDAFLAKRRRRRMGEHFCPKFVCLGWWPGGSCYGQDSIRGSCSMRIHCAPGEICSIHLAADAGGLRFFWFEKPSMHSARAVCDFLV